jgi:hypothetical protein
MRLFHLIGVAVRSYFLASHSSDNIDVTTVLLMQESKEEFGEWVFALICFKSSCSWETTMRIKSIRSPNNP